MDEDAITEDYPISKGDMKRAYDASKPPYQAHVKAQCVLNPCLMNLYQFLSDPKEYEIACRICALEFHRGEDKPTMRPGISLGDLYDKSEARLFASDKKTLEGRILIIENPNRHLVERLGSKLNIDPLFFSLHLHTVHRTSSRYQTPDEATLPSRLLGQDFVNVSYHRSVVCDKNLPSRGRYLRISTVERKLVFLRSTKVGLAQHCVSVIRVRDLEGPWLCECARHTACYLANLNSANTCRPASW